MDDPIPVALKVGARPPNFSMRRPVVSTRAFRRGARARELTATVRGGVSGKRSTVHHLFAIKRTGRRAQREQDKNS